MNRFALPALLALLAFPVGCDKTESATSTPTPPVPEDSGRTPTTGPEPDAGSDAGVKTPDDERLGVRDRAGRPLVFRILASEANQSLYNSSDAPYPVDPTARGAGAAKEIGADLQSALVTLDALDGKDDWKGGAADAPPDGDGIYPHPLVNAWLTDVVVVDPQMPFSPNGYLDVETNPGANATCGGRWFADDAVDKTISFLITGTTSGVSDGVNAATKAPSLTFPYLASPN